MSEPAIIVENLSKNYRIVASESQQQTWSNTVKKLVTSPFDYLRNSMRPQTEEETLRALKDVSFKVNAGEIVGIIGRNGAGKSTLLKILSRVTEPTAGRAVMYGNVGALLEVGTGFHLELTGRENVFLNGAILGMRRDEIKARFDEIVDFAGVEKFIDMPIKRFSSGMRVRLAFAVAAHLESDILLVDEVLAVGDIAFQKKCFDKMEEVGQQGITTVVVSHDMALITRLCERVILLDSGQVRYDGPVTEAMADYLASNIGMVSQQEWPGPEAAPGNDIVRLKSIKACTTDGRTEQAFDVRAPIIIEFEYWVLQDQAKLNPAIFFLNETGTIVFMSGGMHDPEWFERPRSPGLYRSQCWIPGNFLAEGTFIIHAIINSMIPDQPPLVYVYEKEAIAFQVYDNLSGDSARGQHRGAYFGVVRPILQWKTYQEGELESKTSANLAVEVERL